MCNALTVTKRESAPLPERLCEQLTCCEKNGSVQGNYINRVAKRHNCRITGKTKATCYGGPSTQATRYPQRMSITNNATFAAGGQSFSGIFFLLPGVGNDYLYRLFLHKTGLLFLMKSSSKKHSVDALGNSLVEGWGFIPHFRLRSSRKEVSISSFCASIIFLLDTSLCHGSSHHGADSGYFCSSTSPCRDVFQVCAPIFVRLYSLRNCSRAKAHGANLSDSCSIFLRRLFRAGDGVLVDSLLVILCTCKAMRRSSSHHGDDSYYSDSLALRRWRYSTSRFNAAVTNCPVLSPGIFTASTLFITSCGTLAATVCDFAFTAFVAMLCPPHKKQMQYAGKKTSVQHLTCLTPGFKLVLNTLLMQGAETTKPGSALTLTGLLTKPLNEVTIMAGTQHTQTHPKFIYTFLAVHRDCIADGKNTVHVAADTLVDACEMLNDMGYISATWKGREENTLFIQKCENNFIWRFIALSTAQPRVIHIEATSEQEARQQSPAGCVMVFAARIRQEVHHA